MKKQVGLVMACTSMVAVLFAVGAGAGVKTGGAVRYSGPELLAAVREKTFDPARLPALDAVQQRWVYVSMIQSLRQLDDAAAIALIGQWDGSTFWPAKEECPYFDAVHRSKAVREALIGRLRAADPLAREPRVCWCGHCVDAAVSAGSSEILGPLLPYATDDELGSALLRAASENNAQGIRILLTARPKLWVWAKNMSGETAMHFAAQADARDAMRELIAGGADMNAFPALRLEQLQKTPVDVARRAGHEAMVKLLREAGGLTIAEWRSNAARSE